MRRDKFKNGITALGLGMALGLTPVSAGVPDGNATVNVNVTTSTTTVDQVTEIANDVILESVWMVLGTAYRENKKGKIPPPKFWNIELTVSDAELASAVADIKSELYDLAVIPGRRNSYSVVQDEQTGQELTSVSQSYEEVLSGQETTSQETVDANGAVFGVDYIGDPNDYNTWIAIGADDVNVDVNQVTTTTNFIDAITSTEYQSVAVWSVTGVQSVSPLLLDMDGDGAIQASGGEWLPHRELYNERMAFFDFHGDRFPVLMEWPGPNDGILCRPKEDGSIDGTSLFGTSTGYRDGYRALRVLDKNSDGKIKGEELDSLYVWQDSNSDARPQDGEVQSVASHNITELSLHHKDYASVFVRDGKTERMYDWWPKTFELNRVRLMPKKT